MSMFTKTENGKPVLRITRILSTAGLVLFAAVMLVTAGRLIENVDADEIMVVQDPWDGELHWYTTAGIKWQGWGKVTTYLKRDIYEFDQQSIRFNDAGQATLSGSVQFELPLDEANLTALHTRYRTHAGMVDQVMKRTVDRAIYMTGPLMSSRESYAEKRPDLITFTQDQIANGVYRVEQVEVVEIDPISGEERNTIEVEIVQVNGVPARAEASIVGEFGIRAFNFAIDSLDYDDRVTTQIDAQQEITMQVQTAIAEARQAEQRTLTVTQQGQANAEQARWEQETIKAREVTLAEQKREVARLGAEEADFYRQAQELRAQGDATYKREVMEADGALQQKLAAAVEINKNYATAIQNYTGAWVPNVQMGASEGGSGTTPGGTSLELIELLTAKTARDLSLDMTVKP